MVLPLPAMLPAAAWQGRYHYRPECEAAANSRATLELHASFQCLARVCSLHQHHDMALEHFSHVFLLRSQEHSETAESLMFLQDQRGGRVSFLDTRMPETQERESGLQATQDALHLEKRVSQSLLDLHHLATESSDAHLCHFLETRHLDQQLEFIKELADHLTNVCKMGAPEGGLAEYAFDKLTLDTSDKD